MATTVNEAFDAIDAYMTQNGKGQAFLAKKFIDLFEGKNSPLNVANGPLRTVSDKFLKLGKRVEELDKSINTFNMKVRILISALKTSPFKDLNTASNNLAKKITAYEATFKSSLFKTLNSSTIKLAKKIQSYETALKIPGLSGPTGPNISSKRFFDVFSKIRSDLSAIRTTTMLMQKIMVQNNRESVTKGSNIIKPISTTSKSTNISLFSNNNTLGNNVSENMPKGWIGSIISTVLLGAGSFLGIGMIGRFLSNSPIGRVIVENVKSAFSFLGDTISEFVKSGKFTEMVKDSFSSLRTVFTYVSTGLSDFIKNNKEDIKKSFFGIGETFKKEIYDPAKEGTMNMLKEGDYIGLTAGLVSLVGFYKILTKLPILKQIHSFLVKPSGSFLLNSTKSIGSGLISLFKGAFSMIGTRLLPHVTRLAPLLLARLTPLFLNPITGIIAGLSVIGVSLWKVSGTIKDISDNIKESQEIISNTNKTMSNKLNSSSAERIQRYKILSDKEKDGTITDSDKIDKTVMGYRLEIDKINTERKMLNNRSSEQSWLGSLIGNPSQKIRDMRLSELQRQESEYSKAIDIYMSQKRTNIQDAEIIVPDKRDAHIFSKGGGPFDVALKDVNKKVDTIISILADGFSGLAAVTAQSSGAVAQAVIAGAGAVKTGKSVVIGGSNPIHRHRVNTGNHIEFRH